MKSSALGPSWKLFQQRWYGSQLKVTTVNLLFMLLDSELQKHIFKKFQHLYVYLKTQFYWNNLKVFFKLQWVILFTHPNRGNKYLCLCPISQLQTIDRPPLPSLTFFNKCFLAYNQMPIHKQIGSFTVKVWEGFGEGWVWHLPTYETCRHLVDSILGGTALRPGLLCLVLLLDLQSPETALTRSRFSINICRMNVLVSF